MQDLTGVTAYTDYSSYTDSLTRSRALLLSYLTTEQKQSFERKEGFAVTGSFTKRKYQLRHGSVRDEYDRGYCTLARGGIVTYDLMLMQKLIIESNERYFLRRAVPSGDFGAFISIKFIAWITPIWPWWWNRR